MPFQKGHKLSVGNKGGGRKGYAFEASQLERMWKIIDRDLKMVEEIQKGNDIDGKSQIKLALLQSRVLKMIDKLHATKSATDITSAGEQISPILVEFVNGKDKS